MDLLAECRFGFPKPLKEETVLIKELVGEKNRHVESELHTRRNDERLNSRNRVMIENRRPNVDLQVIVDEKACARYMTKYAAKGEPRSQSASEILKVSISHYRITIKCLQLSRKLWFKLLEIGIWQLKKLHICY